MLTIEKFLVQCKQGKAYIVGVDVVRELYGVMAAKGASTFSLAVHKAGLA